MAKRITLVLLLLILGIFIYVKLREAPAPFLQESVQLYQKGDYKGSRTLSLKAVKNLRFTDAPSLKKEVLHHAAAVELEFGQLDQAIKFLKKALGQYGENEKQADPHYAESLSFLAFSYLQQADYAAADSLLEIAASIQEKTIGDAHADYATTIHWMGLSKFEQRKKEEALPFYLKAKNIRATSLGTSSLSYAISLDRLAEYYAENEEDSLSLSFCQEALEIVGEHVYKNRLLNTLGRVHYLKGDALQAIDFYKASKKIQEDERLTGHPHYALTLSNWGIACQDLGRKEKAIELLEEANLLFEKKFSEHPNYAIALNNLADLYSVEDSTTIRAGKMFEKAAKIFFKFNHLDHFTAASINAANCLKGTEEHERALSNFQQAITSEGFKKMPKLSQAYSYKLYAEALWIKCDTNLYAKADSMIRQGKRVFLENYPATFLNHLYFVGARAEISEMRENLQESAFFYGKSCQQMTDMLMDHYAMMNEEERLYFYGEYLEYFPRFAKSFAVRHPAKFPALYRKLLELQAAVKGASLQISLDQRMNQAYSHNPQYNKLLEGYFSTKQELAQLILYANENASQGSNLVDSLKTKANQLETQISRQSHNISESFGSNNLQASFETIQQSLQPNDALVDFMMVDYYDPLVQKSGDGIFCALVCKKGMDAPQFIQLSTLKNITEMLAQNKGRHSNYVDSTSLSHTLYKAIWQPLESAIGQADRVYICPEGPLHQLPFHALCTDQQSKQLLMEKHDIHYRLSPSDLLRKRPVANKKSIALMGGISYDKLPPKTTEGPIAMRGGTTKEKESFLYLEATKEEVKTIEDLFQQNNWRTNLTMGNEASEAYFKTIARRGNYGIIHLATHGKYYPLAEGQVDQSDPLTLGERIRQSAEPMLRSFLVFAGADVYWNSTDSQTRQDGILNALEVGNMDMSRTDLVVLSACETAKGDLIEQEGVFGLQRAFRLAGVKSLLVSLWPVPDEPTKDLMLAFYQYYLQGGTAASALRQAQLDMAKIYQPYDWAAFVLIE